MILVLGINERICYFVVHSTQLYDCRVSGPAGITQLIAPSGQFTLLALFW